MALGLRPHLSYTLVDGVAIVLDVAQDRYFELSPSLTMALERCSGDGADAAEACDGLRERGLLVEGGNPIGPVAHSSPRDSALESIDPASERQSAIRVAWLLTTTRRRIARGGLAVPLVAREAALRRRPPRLGNDRGPKVARGYERARTLVPGLQICLSESLVLSALLIEARAAHRLVLAVRRRPFFAHAWVEDDRFILSGFSDDILGLTPILVL